MYNHIRLCLLYFFCQKYNKTQLYIARRILASPNWLSFIHDIFDSHASLAHSEYLRTYYKFWLVDWTILLIVDLFVVKILTFIPIKVHRYLGIR